MSGRMERSSVVLASFENSEANRCVDLFVRADGTFGFEEFRRDPEDCGKWTRIGHYSDDVHAVRAGAIAAATASVSWLREIFVNGLRSARSEEHRSEIQSLLRISYAVFCWHNKRNQTRS